MTDKCLYTVLGLKKDATPDQIRRAYRKKAAAAHPDRHPGDPTAATKFGVIQFAYEVLIDPDRKAAYDKDGTVKAPPRTAVRRAKMLELLSDVMNAVLHSLLQVGKSPKSCDVIRRMADEVKKARHELEATRVRVEKVVGGLREIATRAKLKSPGEEDDFLTAVAKSKLREEEDKLSRVTELLDVTTVALDCLGRYSYTHDGKAEGPDKLSLAGLIEFRNAVFGEYGGWDNFGK